MRSTRSTSARSKPAGHERGGAVVALDVVVEHVVEQCVVGERVGVELSRSQLGRRRLGDGRLGDRRGLAAALGLGVAPAGQRPHQGLGYVLERSEAAHGVAVDRRVADRELALVAVGEHQLALGVRDAHDDRAAHARLDVLLGEPGQPERVDEGAHHRLDGHDAVVARRAGAPARRRRPGSGRRSRRSASTPRRRSRRPSASAAMAALREESMPPLKPKTTLLKPFLRA